MGFFVLGWRLVMIPFGAIVVSSIRSLWMELECNVFVLSWTSYR